jgi:hypothetical protein
MIRKIFLFLIVIFLALWQISFFSEFYAIKNYCNFILIGTVLITTVINYKNGLVFALLAGLILDSYSAYNFGLLTVSLLLPVIIINYLFRKLLARKSIYSLALLMTISTLAYNFALSLVANLFYWLNWNPLTIIIDKPYLFTVLIQILIHVILISVLFWIIKSSRRLIRSKFIISEQI